MPLPNLALPLLTYFGLRLGAVLGGALVVERVFNVPGLGLLAFQAIQARDYPVLQALFLLASLGVLRRTSPSNCSISAWRGDSRGRMNNRHRFWVVAAIFALIALGAPLLAPYDPLRLSGPP